MAAGIGTLIDGAMPDWDFGERHTRMVNAPVDAVWTALHVTPVADLPLTRLLMRLRTLGRDPMGAGSRPALAALPPGEVARQEQTQVLLGLVAPTSPRSPVGVEEALRPSSIAELRRPLPDGWVRIAMDFRLVPGEAGTELSTETRVLATGPRARRSFHLYWLAIRGGSGLIRRELLRAVGRRAERSTGG
jgi:hypothetical protein